MSYFLKKLVSRFFFPVPFCLELAVVGLVLLWFTKRQKTGKALVSLGVALLGILSQSFVADRLVNVFEGQYPSLVQPSVLRGDRDGDPPEWVVVLSAGHSPNGEFSMADRPSRATLARLVEGICVHKELPGTRLLLSVAETTDLNSAVENMVRLAGTLGVDRRDVATIEGARDTEEEFELVRHRIGNRRFVLVTSASHMPRAMALCQARGMRPIAAPTDRSAGRRTLATPADLFPDAGGMATSEKAFYEGLGLLWAKLRGRI